MKSFNKIWIPSAGKLCKFAEITHHQEKIILKSLSQGSGAYSSFLYALGVIMTENSMEDLKFTTVDRLFYGIYTRAYCFGNDLEYQVKCPSCNRTVKYSLNLNDVVTALEFISRKFTKSLVLPTAGIEVSLSMPDISRDIGFREYIEAEKEDYVLLAAMENSLFIEYCKIGHNILPFYTYKPSQSLDVLDMLDHVDYRLLMDSIEEFKKNAYNNGNESKLLELNCICSQNLINYDLSPASFDNFLAMIYNGNLNDFYSKELNYRLMFPGADVNDLAPIERDLLINLKNSINQQAEMEDSKDGEMDLAAL